MHVLSCHNTLIVTFNCKNKEVNQRKTVKIKNVYYYNFKRKSSHSDGSIHCDTWHHFDFRVNSARDVKDSEVYVFYWTLYIIQKHRGVNEVELVSSN